jgi:anaerobic selenocysteine-containing dehydrogenase
LLIYAVRNVANYSEPVLARDADMPEEWETLVRLGAILQGLGADSDPSVIDDQIVTAMVTSAVTQSSSPVFGRDVDDIIAALSRNGRRGTARMLDFLLQTGPYGAAFGAQPDGISLDYLLAHPHGVDLGALESRIPEMLRTPSGRIELSPPQFIADIARLEKSIELHDASQMLLVGRRELKSNNSWMHNIAVLTKGSLACTAQLHPDDAQRIGVATGDEVRITSRVGHIEIPVEVTDSVTQGVVSVPHGWGHDMAGTRMDVARRKAGVNSNILSDDKAMDPLSGNAVLSAIPVTVELV